MDKYIFIYLFFSSLLLHETLAAQYTWRAKACVPIYDMQVTFAVQGNAYIIGGPAGTPQVWQYNPNTNTWTQKNNYPGFRRGQICFVINDTAYVGAGLDSNGQNFSTGFYKYNSGSDQWIPIASYPGAARYLAMSFTINGKGYAGCGKNWGGYFSDFYQYDPVADAWTAMASFIGSPRQDGSGLSTGGLGYFFMGYNGDSVLSDCYSYNPSTNSWSSITRFQGGAREGFGSFIINDTMYIAGGGSAINNVGQTTIFSNDCWRYDVSGNSWVQMEGFGCIASSRNFIGNNGCTLGGHGYLFCGWRNFNTVFYNQSLEFGPTDTSFTTRAYVLGNDTSYCGSFSRLLAVNDSCAMWSTGNLGAEIVVDTPATYWVRFNDSCGMYSDTIRITQNAIPIVNLGNDTSICSPHTVLLDAGNAGSTFNWSTGVHTQTISVSNTATYSVTVTNSGGCSAKDTIVVSTYVLHDSLFATNTSCGLSNGQVSVTLSNGSAPFHYIWSNSDTTSTISNLPVGNYSVTVTDASGCTANSSATIISASSTSVQVSPAQRTICAGGSLQLTASGGLYGYTWQPAYGLSDSTIANPVASPAHTTTYIVTSYDTTANLVVNGSFSAGNVGFTSAYTYTSNLGPQNVYYVGADPTTYNFTWASCVDHTTGNGNMMIVNGGSTVSDVWCETIRILPNTNYAFSCWGQSVSTPSPAELQFSINGTTIGSVLTLPSVTCDWVQFYAIWNSGNDTIASICVVDQNTTFSGNDFCIDDVSFNGLCQISDTITITVTTPDTVNLGNDTAYCGNFSRILSTGYTNTTWSTGDTGTQITVTTPGTYWSATSSACGIIRDTIRITQSTAPSFNLGNDTAYCGSFSRTLRTGYANSTWSTGANSAQITVNTPGTYWAVANNVCGTARDTIQITQNPIPVVNLGNDTSICSPHTVLLNAGNTGSTYNWSTGVHTQTISVSTGATYSVTVTNNGCSGADAIVVSTYVLHDSLFATNASCSLNNGHITASLSNGNTPFNYLWSDSNTTASISNLAAGSYSVTVTDASGCTASSSATIIATGPPSVQATPLLSIICPGDTVQLCATPGFVSYQWNDGDTGTCIQTSDGGNYYVTAFEAVNCSAVSNEVTITVRPPTPVTVSVSGDTLTCYPAVSYQWYRNGTEIPGDTFHVLIAIQPGTYTVRIVDTNGCYQTSSKITITGISGIQGASGLNLYPNPASGDVTVQWSEQLGAGAGYKIMDMEGRVLQQGVLGEEKYFAFSTANIPEGLYLLSIAAPGGNLLTKRFAVFKAN